MPLSGSQAAEERFVQICATRVRRFIRFLADHNVLATMSPGDANTIDPNSESSHFYLGEALSKLERWAEAAQAFARANQLNPGVFWSQHNLGVALLMLRPFLGKNFAKLEVRPLWRNIWRRRHQWMAGRFA